MEPSQSFTGTSNLGNITIETNSPGIPLGEENPYFWSAFTMIGNPW
ncbi:MAG: hypothetical protein GDA56_23315 [Hormoscilla sp. GM7CHS1pb]|nr:hypothetical protein [Hormoscilla sp. GM7CHS1pb]